MLDHLLRSANLLLTQGCLTVSWHCQVLGVLVAPTWFLHCLTTAKRLPENRNCIPHDTITRNANSNVRPDSSCHSSVFRPVTKQLTA